MGCNCKQKQAPDVVDDLTAFELIKYGIIDNQKLSHKQKEILYKYYNYKFNENVMLSCANCWDAFIKEKLNELWIRKSIESQQD